MAADTQARLKFRLISGGLQSKTVFASIRITAAPEESPPFEIEARVFEEDTWLESEKKELFKQ